MNEKTPACLVCETTSNDVPLISLHYQERDLWICPQHLPVLIHQPAQLVGRLPGAENFGAAEGHDH
jgi:hypothetical protein